MLVSVQNVCIKAVRKNKEKIITNSKLGVLGWENEKLAGGTNVKESRKKPSLEIDFRSGSAEHNWCKKKQIIYF